MDGVLTCIGANNCSDERCPQVKKYMKRTGKIGTEQGCGVMVRTVETRAYFERYPRIRHNAGFSFKRSR